MFFKSAIKKLFAPLYHAIIAKCIRDLKIGELERLLHHAIGKLDVLEKNQHRIENLSQTANMFLAGLPSHKNSSYDDYPIAFAELLEIGSLLTDRETDPVLITHFFSHIPQVDFNNTSVCIVGDDQLLYQKELEKRGAKNIVSIHASSKKSEQISQHTSLEIFPTNLKNISLGNFDFFLVPSIPFSSLLIKNNLFNLSEKTKRGCIMMLEVKNKTVFSDEPDPKVFLENDNTKIIYNDNYVRSQLHANGFFETECLYTYGNGIDNYFDKKVSRFHYQNGLYIVNKNTKYKKSKKYNNADSSVKIYYARKLPSV